MASCSYIPENLKGEDYKGFTTYRKNLQYDLAKLVFRKALSPTFQKDYKNYLLYDEQNVPTYESVMSTPHIKRFIKTQKLALIEQKKYQPIANNRENYERLISEAYTFNTTSPMNDKLTAIVSQYGDDKITVEITEKSPENDNLFNNQYSTVQLNNKLSKIFRDIGVDVGILEKYETEKTSGQVNFSKAMDIANGFEGLIRVANNAEGEESLPEEFSHLLVGIFRNEPIVKRSLNLLYNNEALLREVLGNDYQKVIDYYNNNENQDELVAEEALGRILQQHLINSTEKAIKEETKTSVLQRLINRLVSWIKNKFRNYDINKVIEAKQVVNNNMGQLAKEFLNGSRPLTKEDIKNAKRDAILNHLREGIDNAEQLIQNAISIEEKRRRMTPSSERDRLTESTNRIVTLKEYVNNPDKLIGIVDYAKRALSDLMQANTQLSNISSYDSAIKFKMIRNINNTLESYTEFIKDFYKTLSQYDDAQVVSFNGEDINLLDLWKQLNTQFTITKSKFEDEVLPPFLSFIAPIYGISPLKDKDGNIIPLKRIFRTATQEDIDRGLILKEDVDTSYFDRWVTSMGISSSIIAQLFDKIVKKAKDGVQFTTMHNVREILNIRKKAEEAGITSFEWMFEKNRDGHKTGYYISEYNYGQFEEDYQKLLDSLNEKYGKHPFGDDYVHAMAERDAWLSENAQGLFGKPLPNEKYLNNDYKNLPDIKKKLLTEFLDYKTQLEQGLQSSQVSRLKAIQRRKTGTQRTIDMLASPNTIFSNIKESFKSNFMKSEDDDQIFGNVCSGLTDFSGREFMTLPLWYTHKLKNPDELSTDVFADLMCYAYMANSYEALDKIIDPLEVGRMVLKQKRLLKTRGGKPIQEMQSKDPVYSEGTENMLIAKYDDFLKSQVYGRYIEPTEEWDIKIGKKIHANVTTQKILSAAMKATSTAYIGFNFLAGVANVATALGMQNIEAAAKEFFSAKNLAKADIEYSKMLPAFLADIGSRFKQSKLALFDELFDIKQDYKGKLQYVQKNSLLQRLFGRNFWFIQLGAGDHWIYNRTGLATAMHKKVSVNGTETSLWDALEVANDSNTGYKIMQLKKGTKNLDGSDINLGDIKREIAHINHTIAGTYNDEDQNAANRVAVGRILQQMRQWIVPQFMRRFESKRTVLDIGREEEGYYRTFFKYITANLFHAQYEMSSKWSELSDAEKANCKRAVCEILQFTSLWIISLMFAGGEGDKKRPWAIKFAEYMVHREIHELGFLTPGPTMVTEGAKTLSSPSVLVSAIGQVGKLINTVLRPDNWTNEIESGNYEGHNNVYKQFMQCPVTPIIQIRSINKMFDGLDDGTKYYMKDYK